jgi:hypothetical protein
MPHLLQRIGARIATVSDRLSEAASARLAERSLRKSGRHPIASGPLGSADQYLALWEGAKAEQNPAVDDYERSLDAAVDRQWLDDLALLTQVSIKKAGVCYYHGRLLYATLYRYAAEHPAEQLTIVETGTARGFGTLCLARALADANAAGKIFTFDVLPHEIPIFWNSISDARGPTTRAELLVPYASLLERFAVFSRGSTRVTLAQLTLPRVHFAFLDSVHTYDHVMAEFGAIRGRQRHGDVLFFDDYTPAAYPGVVKAADEICATEGYDRTVIAGGPRRAYLIARKR